MLYSLKGDGTIPKKLIFSFYIKKERSTRSLSLLDFLFNWLVELPSTTASVVIEPNSYIDIFKRTKLISSHTFYLDTLICVHLVSYIQ